MRAGHSRRLSKRPGVVDALHPELILTSSRFERQQMRLLALEAVDDTPFRSPNQIA